MTWCKVLCQSFVVHQQYINLGQYSTCSELNEIILNQIQYMIDVLVRQI